MSYEFHFQTPDDSFGRRTGAARKTNTLMKERSDTAGVDVLFSRYDGRKRIMQSPEDVRLDPKYVSDKRRFNLALSYKGSKASARTIHEFSQLPMDVIDELMLEREGRTPISQASAKDEKRASDKWMIARAIDDGLTNAREISEQTNLTYDYCRRLKKEIMDERKAAAAS